MARRDQQIDASNFMYSIDRKISALLKITASKRAPHGSEFANRRKRGLESHQLGGTAVGIYGIIREFLS